jgi:predicted RNA binding protein YcfA (HicA-like mRNA interferase family)
VTRLPVCSGDEAIRAFQRAGWMRDRQRGSHVTLVKPGSPVVLTVPLHRELGRGSFEA